MNRDGARGRRKGVRGRRGWIVLLLVFCIQLAGLVDTVEAARGRRKKRKKRVSPPVVVVAPQDEAEDEAEEEDALPYLSPDGATDEAADGETDGGEGGEGARTRLAEHVERGQAALKSERHEEAMREFTAALALDPQHGPALLGRALARRSKRSKNTCPNRAIEDLLALEAADPQGEWRRHRALALEWMALCGTSYARKELALAEALAHEPADAPGRPADIWVTLAELLVRAAQRSEGDNEANELRSQAMAALDRYRRECKAEGRAPEPRGLKLAADLGRLVGEDARRTLATYRDLMRLHPASAEAIEATRLVEEIEFKLEVDKRSRLQGGRPNEAAARAYALGLEAAKAGDLAQAIARFSEAIEESPWFEKAHFQRAVALAKSGDIARAVDDLRRAVLLDPSDYLAAMYLGKLYKREFAGAKDKEAITYLDAALRQRPDLLHLHLLLGELYARDDTARARYHYNSFLQQAPADDPEVEVARRALLELDRSMLREESLPIPPSPAELRLLDPSLQREITKAYIRIEAQEWELAEKILREAAVKHPDQPVVLNHLARVLLAQDRVSDAQTYWEESLVLREAQMDVHEQLGLLLQEDPDRALPHLRRAAELGSLIARYALAVRLWDKGDLFGASEQLDRYLAQAGPYEYDWERAGRLRERIDRTFLWLFVALSLALAAALGLPAWQIYRRFRGASLAQLLLRYPKSYPEVARILSLVRHEILKHNTSFLLDVGRALELESPGVDARLGLLSRRLFGDGRPKRRGRGVVPGGIYGRFLGYVGELERVARSHGARLNLQRKDPIFSPMMRSFAKLATVAPTLRTPEDLSAPRRLELARLLTEEGAMLGKQAFDGLSGLIRSLCVVAVDQDLVKDVYTQVIGEEQFVGRDLAPLVTRGEGARVHIFRTDLEDILANVLRNSLRSSLLYAPPPAGLGIELRTETDDITGLSTLSVRVKDRSPEPLSDEMLRGRYVERGMGITADLLSRYDGSIAVEPEPGWRKAVVLRFFALEDESPEASPALISSPRAEVLA